MLNKEIIKKLKKYKLLLSQHMKIDKLVLFGSYAKGTAQNDSDVDVAIIIDKITGDYFSTTPLLWKLRREIDDRIEPILFEKNHDNSGFLEEILKTGIII
jgi:predicted nucleotidyltransferase